MHAEEINAKQALPQSGQFTATAEPVSPQSKERTRSIALTADLRPLSNPIATSVYPPRSEVGVVGRVRPFAPPSNRFAASI